MWISVGWAGFTSHNLLGLLRSAQGRGCTHQAQQVALLPEAGLFLDRAIHICLRRSTHRPSPPLKNSYDLYYDYGNQDSCLG